MPTILAIIAARNEADIIRQTVRDLIDQGIDVYLLDDGSTDGTADHIRPWLGAGVRGIETLEREPSDRFSLARILARKEELARSLEADWYVNHDADELRDSPIRGLSFAQGIALVDRMGFNAIDFEVFNFWPVDESFRADNDLRSSFPYYEPGGRFDRVQVRCWKRQPEVDLRTSGGHDVEFPDRRVFPIRFILRHYPVRDTTQGRRKIFTDRLPRFDPSERERGWHVQYDAMSVDHPILKPVSALSRFDDEVVRVSLSLHHREVEALHEALEVELDRLNRELSSANVNLTQEREARAEVEKERELLVKNQRRLETQLIQFNDKLAQLEADSLTIATELARMRSSRSWRWTAALRRAADWFGVR